VRAKNSKSSVLPLLLFLFLGFFLGFLVSSISMSQNSSYPTKKSTANTINVTGGPNAFFNTQLVAPDDYYATDDTMLAAYTSQGGMAPPRLVLMKGNQLLDAEKYREQVFGFSENDCIVIWTTNSGLAVEEWESSWPYLTEFWGDTITGPISEKEEVKIGNRTGYIYKMKKEKGEIYVGGLSIGNTEGTSYTFNTCNTKNKSEFISVLQSLKFAGDQF
jgi:hypothetical protein